MKRSDGLAILGLSACLALTSCAHVGAKESIATPEGVPVRTAIAVSEDVPLEVAAVGNIEALESVEVKSRVAGEMKRVAFTEGQDVAKGQLLFTIDLDALQRQAAEQQADLERDIAVEQQARAVMVRDAASQKQSQSDADIAQALLRVGVISGQRRDQLETARETTRAVLESDRAAAAAAGGTVKADRARLAQTQLQLSFTRVTAPIAGRAGAVMVKAGNIIRDNDTTLVNLLQLAPVAVTFGIPEQSLAEVQRLNKSGALRVEVIRGDNRVFDGQLTFVDNAVDTTTGMVRLKAAFANADRALWPGEFVNVRLRLRMEKGRTLVPEASIQDGLDGKYVWCVRSGTATVAPVDVLRTYTPMNGTEMAILGNGIHPGDTVVTEGQLRLTPGARISPLNMPHVRTAQNAPSR